MNYTSREVVRRLKQYDMFLNSLKLTEDEIQRERICDQLDKIEKQILLDTNTEYEEEYLMLLSQKTKFIDEEKTRLRSIISLINDRKEYLNKRKNEHRKITGSLVELTSFLGEDKLSSYKKRLDIIEKYEKNKETQEELIKEMKVLDIKISEASRNVKANTRLNESLEKKMILLVDKSLNKLGLYKLGDRREEISKKHSEFKYALALAKDNLKSANELGDPEYILECNDMYNDVNKSYLEYNEELNIINLINIFDQKTNNYQELLTKRENIDTILKNITLTELYKEINSELSKQYNTIKLEGNDIKNYETLKEERNKRNKKLYDIEEENNSKEFKEVLEELVKNENRYREEQVKKARHEEQVERQKKLAEEQKIEAARVRRQKLIEEARLKEQLAVAENLKKLQDKTVIKKDNSEIDTNINKEYEKILPKTSEDTPKVEIKNPLKNKTLEEIMSNDFDTDELFENTKITPNKVLREDKKTSEVPIWNESTPKQELPKEMPIWQESIPKEKAPEVPKEEVKTLFNDISTASRIEVPETKEPPKAPEASEVPKESEEVAKKASSIYDILENNSNIIWKTTTASENNKKIPVIGNNKLKPEVISSDSSISFPDLKKKEGEVLWKETL